MTTPNLDFGTDFSQMNDSDFEKVLSGEYEAPEQPEAPKSFDSEEDELTYRLNQIQAEKRAQAPVKTIQDDRTSSRMSNLSEENQQKLLDIANSGTNISTFGVNERYTSIDQLAEDFKGEINDVSGGRAQRILGALDQMAPKKKPETGMSKNAWAAMDAKLKVNARNRDDGGNTLVGANRDRLIRGKGGVIGSGNR